MNRFGNFLYGELVLPIKQKSNLLGMEDDDKGGGPGTAAIDDDATKVGVFVLGEEGEMGALCDEDDDPRRGASTCRLQPMLAHWLD